MRCETARTAISQAMDDLRAVAPNITDHVSGCAECRDFLHGVRRIRELTRFEVASDVPDLVPAIMTRVQAEAAAMRGRRSRRRAVRPPRLHAHRRRVDPRTRRVVGVGLAAGLVTGVILTGGGVVSVHQTDTAALADVIPARLNGAASTLEGYRATFDITELDWTRAVPQRTFVADLAFREPESFLVRVHDTTRYPSAAWPRNDLSLVSDGHTWQATGPNPCPRAELPACPQSQPVVRTVIDRMPFDASTAMPTDVIVPMTVLAASDRVDVVGPVTVDGREAIVVELTYQDATPLFGCLQFLGSWRPFYPTDRVLVALDQETWLPLRYQVYPAPTAERLAWAAAEGLPRESPTAPIFTSTIRSVSTQVPPTDTFTLPPVEGAVDEGFKDLPLSSVALVAQATLIEPKQTEGLPVVRIGTLARTAARPYQAVTFAYARGLSWLTITRVTSWGQQAPYGVGPLAEAVPLLGGSGVALYEPASANDPRRLALHTDQGEFLVASNLPRSDLVAVASSLPVKGLALPETWSNRTWYGGSVRAGLGVEDAIFQAGFDVLLPRVLPTGYGAAAALLVQSGDSKGITITYRRPAAELGDGLLLTESTGQSLPPPNGANQQVVSLRGTLARWSPDEGRLEWIENGLYCSLAGPGFGLADLVSIAASLRGV
jgi:hypothetical protein